MRASAAFLKDAAREDGDAIAVAHLGVLRAAYTLATGWDMATPMPPELDISKVLIVEACTSDACGSAESLCAQCRNWPLRTLSSAGNVSARPRTA